MPLLKEQSIIMSKVLCISPTDHYYTLSYCGLTKLLRSRNECALFFRVILSGATGRYFRSAPSGWRVSETNTGVTLTSPDGAYSASLATILRSRGTRTPTAFLQWIFAHVPGWSNTRIVSAKNLPNQRMSYQVWQFIEAKVSYTDNGLPVTGVYKTGVANYAGMNDAMIVGYRAPNAKFEEAQSFMAQI
jgi:hypothetical protein